MRILDQGNIHNLYELKGGEQDEKVDFVITDNGFVIY